MPICRCGKTLFEVNEKHRYCAHCGTAHFARCLNSECEEDIFYQQSPCCPSCGALYRYTTAGIPVRQTSVNTNSASLYDLLPASGDPFAAKALYAKFNAEYPSTEPELENFTPFVNTAFHDAQVRHNRLYVLKNTGQVEVLSASTLHPIRSVKEMSLPNFPKSGIREGDTASLQVGTYALLLRYQSQVYGYHAGSGEPLFQLSGEDFQSFSVVLNQECLLLVGSTNREQRAYLYRLSDLCQKRKQPLREEILAPSPATAHLPPNRSILPHYKGFYVFAQNGTLYHIEVDGKISDLPIPSQTYIQAWGIGDDYGAVLFHPDAAKRKTGSDYQILTFPVGSSFDGKRQIPISWKPHEQLRSLVLEDDHFYTLDKDLNLLWLHRDTPNDTRHKDSQLQGAEGRDIELMSIPYGNKPYVLFHSVGTTRQRHYFAWGRPPLKEMRFIPGVFPGFKKKIRPFYSANRLLLVNMDSGSIQTKTLPTL